MVAKKQQWPKKNLIIGTIILVAGVILYTSKANPKYGDSAQSLKRVAYVLMGIGCINIFLGLICYIVHLCSDNRPRRSNSVNTPQQPIEPSVHVIAVQEPIAEVRNRYTDDDPPPSYEEVIKNSRYPSGQFLHVPSSNINNDNVRSNSFSNHQVLPSRSPIK